MLDWLTSSFLYSLVRDGVGYFRRRQRRLTNSEIIARRHKWKAEFETRIWESHRQKLRKDVIIRDMRRIDNYPDDLDGKKGISPWFRAGLMGSYHRGILLGLSWGTLTKDHDGEWRYTDYSAGEGGDVKVILIGRVRYEDIEEVEWDGDEFYGLPHIYCFFSHGKEPYEDVGFYTQTEPRDGLPFYTLVAPFQPVHRRSRRGGLADFT